MKKLRVGIVGAGQIADYHIRSYLRRPDVEVAAVCDTNLERARSKAAEYAIERRFQSHRELCEQEDIQAVSVTTWTNTHESVAVDFLEAGKDVLCEKPPSVSAQGARRMHQAAQRNRRLLMFGFVRRFGQSETILKRYIGEGRLGNIYYAKAGYIRRCGCPGGWFTDRSLSGGGALIDIGIHMLDLSLYFMGHPRPVSVMGSVYGGMGSKLNIRGIDRYRALHAVSDTHDVEDMANALVRFENGASLFLETGWTMNIRKDEVYLDLCGDLGGAQLEPQVEIFGEEYDHLVDIRPVLHHGALDLDLAFAGEIGHFADCLLYGEKCVCPSEEGVEVMRIIDAVYASARTGELVKLS